MVNKHEQDVLLRIFKNKSISTKELAEKCGCPLGTVKRSLEALCQKGYLGDNGLVTEKAKTTLDARKPQRAIILAAGFGMRMVPINTSIPKALLEVDGEKLIEKIIQYLHKVNIYEVHIVVGFMKERFDYLVAQYGVKLIENKEYATKNNLHSLALASEHLENAYIIPCDIWCNKNPFHTHELYSWYMVSDLIDDDSNVRINRRMELEKVHTSIGGNTMIGIAYLNQEDAIAMRKKIVLLDKEKEFDNAYWEEALYDGDKVLVYPNVVHSTDFVEINTYEQLREIDSESNQLKTNAIQVIKDVLKVDSEAIINIRALKKGMTNRSFLFECQNQKYIMRIPGEGTDKLINRTNEAAVYRTIDHKNICENLLYINPNNGYKITEFLEGARECDATNEQDLRRCMAKLREFHQLGLQVDHDFDIIGQIDFYESLWNGKPSIYSDYKVVKKKVLSLSDYIHQYIDKRTLTHIDAVPDNFLFVKNTNGDEDVYLIDWEYAGMQDPHVDIAMFCIYALYDRPQLDRLIDLYFIEGCPDHIRIKIYCYIAQCGLLWSNWCEYKSQLGIEFGEYSTKQYEYAKEYYEIVYDELKKRGEHF